MLELFRTAWDDLTLDAVRAFLDGAEDEPLVWEAKGTEINAHHVRKTVAGFANSHDGGYLILGATQRDNGWTLDGVELPDEAPKWVSSVVLDGLRPAPGTDVRAFGMGPDLHVVVVRVAPLADPPCVARGTVYERVAGQTVAVKDPQRLAALYQRGDRAHASALARAEDATSGIRAISGEHLPRRSRVTLAVAPMDVPQPHVTDVLFSSAFKDLAATALHERVKHPSVPLRGTVQGVAGQDSLSLTGTDPSERHAWRLRACWDGTVAMEHLPFEAGREAQALVREHVTAAWRESTRLAASLGCGTAHYVVISLDGPEWGHKAGMHLGGAGPATIRRGPVRDGVTDALLDDVMAEVARIEGQGFA